MIIPRVLIENGSIVNVCPSMTFGRIGVEESMIHPNGMMVREFGGTKTSACGEIDFEMLIRPYEFEVCFVVVDITDIFNLL